MTAAERNNHYDYIIAGAGAAGLSLLVRMIASGKFSDKKILLLDKAPKNRNDRTWCFWEKGPGFFEELVYRKWDCLWFRSNGFSGRFDIQPYEYKMIRGIDFYNHCMEVISSQKNVTVQYGTVSDMQSNQHETLVMLDNVRYTAGYIFNSILFSRPVLKKNEFFLLQHFKGWIIETRDQLFNDKEATLMDFRVSQHHGTTFVYVMPFSANRALVEYTLFTKEVLSSQEYDTGLQKYINECLFCNDYKVLEAEYGVIPMTNFRFAERKGNIIHIGTAGGQTKASTGYTFQFIQKKTAGVVEALLSRNDPHSYRASSPKFRFYDGVFLNVLASGKMPGDQVFTRLFNCNPTARIFEFLDNESSLYRDLQVIGTLPVLPFLRAGIQQLF